MASPSRVHSARAGDDADQRTFRSQRMPTRTTRRRVAKQLAYSRHAYMLRPLHAALVESAWGAVPVLPSVRFPRPLAEPAVRVSTLCRIRHTVEYAEPRIMPSRWSLRLVRWLSGGVVFGIIWAPVRIDAVFAGAGCSGGGGVIMNRPSPSRVRVS